MQEYSYRRLLSNDVVSSQQAIAGMMKTSGLAGIPVWAARSIVRLLGHAGTGIGTAFAKHPIRTAALGTGLAILLPRVSDFLEKTDEGYVY